MIDENEIYGIIFYMIQTTYQINDKGVGHHENNNFRKKHRINRGA